MPRQNRININKYLRDARERACFTQEDLAKEASKYAGRTISEQTIWNIENKKTRPIPRNRKAIAQALGVPAEKLFPLDEDEPAKIAC